MVKNPELHRQLEQSPKRAVVTTRTEARMVVMAAAAVDLDVAGVARHVDEAGVVAVVVGVHGGLQNHGDGWR